MLLKPLILAIDAGNTRVKLGVFRATESEAVEPLQIRAVVIRESVDLSQVVHAWARGVAVPGLPIRTVIAGSQPEIRDQLVRQWPEWLPSPLVISEFQQIPVEVDVEFPGRVGIDRLLNAYAASRLCPGPRSLIAIDSGTATTVDLMTADQVFRGGTILPGLRLSAIAMHEYTARLPLLNVDEEMTEIPELPGRNTEAAMRAGLFWGQLGAVREIAQRLAGVAAQKFGDPAPPEVFLSGGGGRQMLPHLPHARFVDSLALQGLAFLCCRDLLQNQ